MYTKKEKKLTPEERKELLLSVAEGLRKNAEENIIEHISIESDHKVVRRSEGDPREHDGYNPWISKGFRYIIDVDYLKPKEE